MINAVIADIGALIEAFFYDEVTAARCPAPAARSGGSEDRANFRGLVREAVSKPNFSRKYAFESSRRDLHNALLKNFAPFSMLNFLFKNR